MIKIRNAKITDAGALIELRKKLFRETDFLLLEPEEYTPTQESESSFIQAFNESGNSAVFLAFDSHSNMIGFMGVAGGTTNRTAHKATIFMGILKEYWGRGVGRQFFKHLFSWEGNRHIVRYELTTATNNTRAFSLYRSAGFKVECVKKKNILVNGALVDEYQMCYINPANEEHAY